MVDGKSWLKCPCKGNSGSSLEGEASGGVMSLPFKSLEHDSDRLADAQGIRQLCRKPLPACQNNFFGQGENDHGFRKRNCKNQYASFPGATIQCPYPRRR